MGEKLGAGQKSLIQEESLFGVKPGEKMRLKRGWRTFFVEDQRLKGLLATLPLS